MSNRTEPKLNTPLPEMPKQNIILPLNLRSTQFNSFPNMKTPKLQPLNKDGIFFPNLRGIKVKNSPKKRNNPNKKIIKKKENNKLYRFLFILLISLISVSLSYTVMLYIKNNYF